MSSHSHALSRRSALAATAAAALAAATPRPARAQSREIEDLARQLVGTTQAKQGKIRLKIKDTAESGANEPVGVTVDSPMTPVDFVKTIHVMAEGNPYPVVASWHLTPRSGRAEVNFRIRLAKTQFVRAYAVLSDGSVWMDRQEIKVTIGGCGG